MFVPFNLRNTWTDFVQKATTENHRIASQKLYSIKTKYWLIVYSFKFRGATKDT